MEIMDDGDGRPPRPPPRPQPGAAIGRDAVPVNLDAGTGDDGTSPARDRSRIHRALDAVLSSEALGGAGLFVVLLGMVSSTPDPFAPFIGFSSTEPPNPRELAEQALEPMLLGAVCCLLLGLLALLRLPARAGQAARALSGAATVVGVLVLLWTVRLLGEASALPDDFATG